MRTVGLMLLLCSCLSLAGGPATPAPAVANPAAVAAIEGDITDRSVGPLIMALRSLPQMAVKPPAVVLHIDSPGGEYDAGFRLAKAIEDAPVPVICIVDGDAASMAFFVLQSCDSRIATPRSTLMIHETALIGKIRRQDVGSLVRSMEVKNAALAQQCTKKAKISVTEFLAKIGQGDWWMTPQEALTLGFLDAVR